jgi:hypothetical protein
MGIGKPRGYWKMHFNVSTLISYNADDSGDIDDTDIS